MTLKAVIRKKRRVNQSRIPVNKFRHDSVFLEYYGVYSNPLIFMGARFDKAN